MLIFLKKSVLVKLFIILKNPNIIKPIKLRYLVNYIVSKPKIINNIYNFIVVFEIKQFGN